MRIILSPTKKMRIDDNGPRPEALPVFIDQTEAILTWLRGRTPAQLKALWGCNDKIAAENFARLESMDLRRNLSPALFAYDGIAFQYMAPAAFEDKQLSYVQEHLRILSAFYGVLKPMDGVTPYRLEMQAKAAIGGYRDLYQLWDDRIYREVRDDSCVIVDLASAEYAKCVEKYLQPGDRYVRVDFREMSATGKLVTRATYAKMVRGEMVRFMAENDISRPEDLRGFDRLGYVYRGDISSEDVYVFERVKEG